ncbi:MAG: hypothetical protein RL427_1097 [Bacteroidota bacterium]
MKELYVIGTFFILLQSNFTANSQVLQWSQCDLNIAGSPSNFNYSKTFNGVPQSSTDVELTIGFIVCQPYSTNSAGIRLNGTTFSQDNVPANSCSALFTTYTISKSVFNQAVIDGGGTIVFSYFVRDTCPSGWGCSFANDPCINFTVSYTDCTSQATPTFTQVAPICSGATLAPLPVDSNNGINGIWSPTMDNTATTTYTFTPTAGQCATATTMTIEVNPNVTPTFTQAAPICSGATLAALPVDSNNGINGTWVPEINNTETTSYTFTPASGQCASSTTMDIAVIPNLTPVFIQVEPICYGETGVILPVDSTNGISGAWSPAINNTTMTTYTFTPGVGQCAIATEMTIGVNQEVPAPAGNATQTFCDGETVGNIIVEGNSVVWYDAPTLGNIVPNTTVLVAGTTYYAAQSIAPCQSNSRLAVTVSNGTCLAMDTFEKEKVKLYPNPIKNTLNISNNEVFTKVIIYNAIGQEVIAKTTNTKECSIDTSTLAAGSYMVKIVANNKSKTIKVIKE